MSSSACGLFLTSAIAWALAKPSFNMPQSPLRSAADTATPRDMTLFISSSHSSAVNVVLVAMDISPLGHLVSAAASAIGAGRRAQVHACRGVLIGGGRLQSLLCRINDKAQVVAVSHDLD